MPHLVSLRGKEAPFYRALPLYRTVDTPIATAQPPLILAKSHTPKGSALRHEHHTYIGKVDDHITVIPRDR
jgi:hypothetical protein